jgi:arginase family enzyme
MHRVAAPLKNHAGEFLRSHADIVEYNPRCDISNMTAAVAGKLVK